MHYYYRCTQYSVHALSTDSSCVNNMQEILSKIQFLIHLYKTCSYL